MPGLAPSLPRGQVSFRCDGDERVGAGHVARCVPLAKAFEQLGWRSSFVGEYAGIASWLLERAQMTVLPPDRTAPCGLVPDTCDGAVVDSYRIAPDEICELAATRPVVTLGEANRCPERGTVIDYHLDAAGRSDARLLAGPSFAPLDPAFARAGRAGEKVRSVLVTLGGSLLARELLEEILPAVGSVFADAEILVAGPLPDTGAAAVAPRLVGLRSPSALVDVVGDVDLAVTAAGLTAYELACAGIPQVAIAIVANQRRVVKGLRERSLAPCLDLTSGDSPASLTRLLRTLLDPSVRRELSRRGMETFDGGGALRAAGVLAELFLQPPPAADDDT